MVKSKNFVYTAQQQNMVKTYDFIDSGKAQTFTIFDDIDATSCLIQVSKCF